MSEPGARVRAWASGRRSGPLRLPPPGTTWDPVRIWRHRGSIAGKRYAVRIRRSFVRRLARGDLERVQPAREVPLDLLAFTCERDIPEQVLSLRSFLGFVGAPRTLTVASDGSISDRSIDLLRHQYPQVEVRTWSDIASLDSLPDPIADFARTRAYGRKLAVLYALHPTDTPLVYADCDVLFFPPARELTSVLAPAGPPRYVEDAQEALDVRIVPTDARDQRRHPLNSGFLIQQGPIDWSDAVVQLGAAGEPDAPGFGWTEQTVVHVAYRASGALPLPQQQAVVALDDATEWHDRHVHDTTWLRHYVTGTRFKMWLNASRVENSYGGTEQRGTSSSRSPQQGGGQDREP